MRLALIRQRYNPFGGAERFIERAIAALEREGTEVTMITRAWDAGSGRRALIVDPPYAGRLWRDASFSRGVRALLARERFDLVQSHERIAGCDVYRAGDGVHRQWLEHRAVEASFMERLGIRLNPYHWYTCAAERSMFEHPSLRAVICNSQMVAAEIRRHFAIAAEKLHVIYNGVDLEHFHPHRRQELRAAARSEFGCKEGDSVFSFVGSGFARKGLAAAIDALAATGRGDFRILVAGRDRATERFAARAARAGLAGQVVFLGGREDVRSVYAASDCFILPTRYDPFPNAALEALARGIPVIVSTRCGAAEIVEQGRNGWVCAPDSAGPLAQLMVEAAGAAGDGIASAARRTAEGYGVERMAERMIGLYAMLLGSRPSGAAAGL
jgi:UDP-glucose:(heptosyl)LPS alpha-1,3-glucosyltransferase